MRGTHVASSVGSGALERELVLRAADARLDRQVLHRLHVERDALDVRGTPLQPVDERASALMSRSPCGFRLISMRPLFSVVFWPSTPMNDERLATAGSSSIALRERLLALRHRGERDRLRRFGDRLDHAGVLHREEALRHEHVEQHGQRAACRAPPAASAPGASSTQSSITP